MFLIKATLKVFRHVNEVCQCLLFDHWNGLEMTSYSLEKRNNRSMMDNNKPQHRKTNKMTCARSEDSDQTAQADLSLCWAHMSICWFCHAEAQLIFYLWQGITAKMQICLNQIIAKLLFP